ncbi:MAG: diacylglycerol kinase family protein [Bacteroidota bacterium]
MSHLHHPWRAIVNPAAARGRARKQWMAWLPTLQSLMPQLEWAFTESPGQAMDLAEQWVHEGCRHLVAVGGDGTHHEVCNGIFSALGPERAKEVLYTLLPLGSGNDWIRTHGQKRGLEAWLKLLEHGQPRLQSVGLVSFTNQAGEATQRYVINVAGMAYDAFVVRRAEGHPLKRKLLYPVLTLILLRQFQPPKLRLRYDDQPVVEDRFYTINAGPCRYSGGGMRLVPQADPQSDTMALTFARSLSIWRILQHSWRFYTGSIGEVKEVTTTQAARISVSALSPNIPLEIEADGEWLGYGPVEIVVLPEVLRYLGWEAKTG